MLVLCNNTFRNSLKNLFFRTFLGNSELLVFFQHFMRTHSFSTYPYQGVRNVNFPENVVYILNE